jgi:histidinol-phosphate/aromatic aminotransferase/cobyric acid decarboxylase-like protein
LRARKSGGLVIVDEAFADLEDEALSLAPHLSQPGLLVLRSLSKPYGLGGSGSA